MHLTDTTVSSPTAQRLLPGSCQLQTVICQLALSLLVSVFMVLLLMLPTFFNDHLNFEEMNTHFRTLAQMRAHKPLGVSGISRFSIFFLLLARSQRFASTHVRCRTARNGVKGHGINHCGGAISFASSNKALKQPYLRHKDRPLALRRHARGSRILAGPSSSDE